MQMRRQRTIKPSLWTDPRVTSVSMSMRAFAIALILWADDHGRGEILPRRMGREMLPDDDVSPERIEDAVLRLDQAGFLMLYADEDGRSLFQIAPDLLGTVDRRQASAYPDPPFANPFANRVANRGLRGERESGGRVEFEGEAPVPPSPFCTDHPAGTRRDCRQCGTARMRSRRWEQLHRAGKDTTHLEVDDDDFDGYEDPF